MRRTHLRNEDVSVSSKHSWKPKVLLKASCECVLGCNPNPGWSNHLKSCTVENRTVIDWCRNYVAMSVKRSSRWIRLNNHLSNCPGLEPSNWEILLASPSKLFTFSFFLWLKIPVPTQETISSIIPIPFHLQVLTFISPTRSSFTDIILYTSTPVHQCC